ncbi:MAG TPA: HepT-like ribonuclease domain-containing protein [Bauldia sp.]|nr:HepT-like ribonuclease domain-containing protein [Bauldia sp.]
MVDRVKERLLHIQQAIQKIRDMLAGRSLEEVARDPVIQAAFERFLEIISEAARHVPEQLTTRSSQEIPWRRIRDLGNRLRHEYQRVDPQILWSVYENDLDPLEKAVDAMLAAHAGSQGGAS